MTQDSTAERRRARMAFMDDKKGTQAMTTPKLKPCPFCGGGNARVLPATQDDKDRLYPFVRCFGCFLDMPGRNEDYSTDGKTAIAAWNTRADLSQAAIAAAMMGVVKPLEWVEFRNDTWRSGFEYEICWNDGDEYRIRQNGKVILKAIKGFSRAVEWVQRIHAASILSALSIPTDAMAALEAVKAQVRDDALEEAAAKIKATWANVGLLAQTILSLKSKGGA